MDPDFLTGQALVAKMHLYLAWIARHWPAPAETAFGWYYSAVAEAIDWTA
jgi:hypothetical protein